MASELIGPWTGGKHDGLVHLGPGLLRAASCDALRTMVSTDIAVLVTAARMAVLDSAEP